MAFGKDPNQVKNFSGTFRQQTAGFQAHKKQRSGGGGGIPSWINKFQPSLHEIELVRLIPTMCVVPMAVDKDNVIERSLPYMTYVEHFDGHLKKSSVCSAGPFRGIKGKGQPCRGCEIFWGTMAPDPKSGRLKRGKRMSMRDMAAFTVVHFAPYAHVVQLDQHGAPRVNEQTQQPYLTWERILPHEKAKYAGAEIAHAKQLQWPMGMSHFNTLWEYDEQIGASCSTCGGRDTIESLAHCCSNCGEALIEMDSTTLPPDQLKQAVLSEAKCPRCAHFGYLSEIFSCRNCASTNHEARRATLFDVDLSLKRVAASDGSDQTTLMISKWSDPHPIDPQFAEMAKPMALEKIYAPTPMQKQIELFGAVPTQRTPVNTGTTPYTG